MRIAMIGAGYVGLVTAACLADFGHDITCIDQDVSRVDQLRTGCPPIYEPGLDVLLEQNLASGRLRFTTDLRAGVAEVDVVFLAVGTPARRGGGHADLTFVYSAATEVAQAITRPTVLVTKSTVPVGTADAIEGLVAQVCPGARVTVVSNPEFLREGCAIEDFKRPDRIVVGTTDDSARAVMEELYAPVCTKSQLMFTGRRTAELIKYASNAFLATKISFINEIADLCEVVGADVRDVAHGMGMDHRIGPKFLDAGPGYGGSCFPKDTIALVRTAQDHGVPVRIIESAVAVNEARKCAMARKVALACGGNLRGKTIAVLGLTFKPNTDDMREAPSIEIIAGLQRAGAHVRAHDPIGRKQASLHLEGVEFCADPYECAEGAHALTIITDWDCYRVLDPFRLKAALRTPTIVDLRNCLNGEAMQKHGLHYASVGLPSVWRGASDRRQDLRRAVELAGAVPAAADL